MILEKRVEALWVSEVVQLTYGFSQSRTVWRKKDLEIEHCPTDMMLEDFFTKPLQGSKFQYFRNLILGGQK